MLLGDIRLTRVKATAMNNTFVFFTYLTPTLFVIISDARIGRHKTLLISLGYEASFTQ